MVTDGEKGIGIRARLKAQRARLRASPLAMEMLNAMLLVSLGVVLVALGDVHFWGQERPRWVHLVPVLVAGVAAVLRRTSIAVSLLLSAVAIALDAGLGGSIVLVGIVLDALYNAAQFAGQRLRRVVIGVCAIAAVLLAEAFTRAAGSPASGTASGSQSFVLNLLQVAALLGTPLWWGSNVRQRNEIAAMADERVNLERARAVDIERLAVLDRHEAVRAERSRMASDLHDAIASRLSAIAIHSGAALAAPPSSERDRGALDLARSSSIAALEDMRAMITVLRSEQSGSSADAAPSPPIEWLSQLAEGARATGSEVRIHGEVPEGLPPALGQAIYRIVQESLTNAAKHAPRSTVDLRFDFVASTGRVLVQNDIPVERTPQTLDCALNSGAGLEIMRERAEAFGGTLFAGARHDRWCVEIRVPVPTGGRVLR